MNLKLGEIDSSKFYTKGELKDRFGIGGTLYRRLLANGLQVTYLGRDAVVQGESLLQAIARSLKSKGKI